LAERDESLTAEKAKNAELEKTNVELSRDITVREALRTLDFRSVNANEMAFKDITEKLVQNDEGTWVHTSGKSISEYVTAFSEDENNGFLFKAKTSSGSGTSSSSTGTSTGSGKSTSLFDRPQSEVLKMAEEGKLRR